MIHEASIFLDDAISFRHVRIILQQVGLCGFNHHLGNRLTALDVSLSQLRDVEASLISRCSPYARRVFFP